MFGNFSRGLRFSKKDTIFEQSSISTEFNPTLYANYTAKIRLSFFLLQQRK